MKRILVGTTILAGSFAQAATETPRSGQLEEVIVTATRREQSEQDVAGGLQVFVGQELERAGANQYADYLLAVPGVSFRDQGGFTKRIALRGISSLAGSDNGVGSPTGTVGTYLNDISIADTAGVSDLAIYDLERIEVLKGPQGTLYGEGAMGGAIKMILKSPSLSKTEGRAETSLSNTQSGGFNYQVRGMFNAPLVSDRLALRLVGSYEDRDGFIDNVATGQDNFNTSHGNYAIRGTLRWQPTDALNIELLALHNQQHQAALDQIDSRIGKLEFDSPEDQDVDGKNDVFGLTIRYDMAFASLTSITSRYESKHDRLVRFPVFGAIFSGYGTVSQNPGNVNTDLSSVSQELRLVSNGDQRLDWVAGAFYRDKKQDGLIRWFLVPADLPSVNTGLGAFGLPGLPASGTMLAITAKDGYEQYAAYGELNFALFDNLELIAGLRYFDETVAYHGDTIGYSLVAALSGITDATIKEDGFIPKFGLSYKISDDHHLYAQAAKGFRSGVTNGVRSFQVGGDGASSDNLWNYELGAKTNWLDHRLRLNASVFYVDWKNVQTAQSAISPARPELGPLSFFVNGGDAELTGAELELAVAPTEALLLGTNAGYTHGKMVRVAADSSMINGSPLPNVPEWTASGYFEYRVPVSLTANSHAFMRFDVSYTDKQATRSITTSNDGWYVDAYSIGKLQLGVDAGRWLAMLFVDNLWDERAQYGRGVAGVPAVDPEIFSIARPRTYGIRASMSF